MVRLDLRRSEQDLELSRVRAGACEDIVGSLGQLRAVRMRECGGPGKIRSEIGAFSSWQEEVSSCV